MGNVAQSTNRTNITVRCPDGFGNQLRLALAGSFLVTKGFIKSYTQEWIINNHNNVDFLDYFLPLPGVKFAPIELSTPDNDIISTTTFEMMINTFSKNSCSWQDAFETIKPYLIPKENIWNEAQRFIQSNNIQSAVGVHVRRTCKLAILQQGAIATRSINSIQTNEQVLELCKLHNAVFLATDNRQTQQWFADKLKDKCKIFAKIKESKETFDGSYDRNKVERFTSKEHCVMDFIILQHCSQFIGSNESSFSQLIKNIRKNEKDPSLIGKL